jgi:hypothetical protein
MQGRFQWDQKCISPSCCGYISSEGYSSQLQEKSEGKFPITRLAIERRRMGSCTFETSKWYVQDCNVDFDAGGGEDGTVHLY